MHRVANLLLFLTLGALVACVEPEEPSNSSSGGTSSSGQSGVQLPTTYGPDTCSGGTNMTAPAITGPAESDPAGTRLRIRWEKGAGRGADLPPAYFDRPTVSTKEPSISVEHVAERELAVILSGAPATYEGRTVAFLLGFADRRDFITCTHPGMKDSYVLDVSIVFGAGGAIASSTLKEGYSPGDI